MAVSWLRQWIIEHSACIVARGGCAHRNIKTHVFILLQAAVRPSNIYCIQKYKVFTFHLNVSSTNPAQQDGKYISLHVNHKIYRFTCEYI
jgi:hypothetical protein